MKVLVVKIIIITTWVSCNNESPTTQSDSKYVEVELSSMNESLEKNSSEMMSSGNTDLSVGDISSESGLQISSELSTSLSSSSFEPSENVSSEVVEPLAILFQKFPISTVKPDTSFDLEWISSGSSNRLVNLYMSVNRGELELVVEALSSNKYTWVLDDLENGDRVQLRIEVYEPLTSSDTLWDQTGIFDIHSGVTLLDYKNDIQPLVQKYCVDCHGGSSTEGGFNISSYANLTKGNNEKYAVNRMFLIGDMPTEEYENQPDSLQRWQLRDWVLGGAPE